MTAKGRTWRAELAHQFERAIASALVIAGFELVSIYLGGS